MVSHTGHTRLKQEEKFHAVKLANKTTKKEEKEEEEVVETYICNIV